MSETETGETTSSTDTFRLDELGPVSALFTVRLQRVDYFFRRALREIETEHVMRTGTIGCLSIVIGKPGISQNEVVDRTRFDKSAVNAIVNVLAERGWVERRSVPTDRRRYALHATEAGVRTMTEFVDQIRKIEMTLLADLNDDERGDLLFLLDRTYASTLKCQRM